MQDFVHQPYQTLNPTVCKGALNLTLSFAEVPPQQVSEELGPEHLLLPRQAAAPLSQGSLCLDLRPQTPSREGN